MSPAKVDKIEVPCSYCGTILYRYPCLIKAHKNHFCDVQCKALWQSENCRGKNATHHGPNPNLQGENNPNFGTRWTEEQRKHASEISKERFKDPRMRWLVGAGNRGKKFSPERIARMHSNRTSESYSHPHSEESKQLIGKKSKEKFTQEYNTRFRKTMEELGYWIPEDDITDWMVYFKEANWVERMWGYCSDQGKELLSELGVFNSNNTRGVVRGHIFSRRDGFEQGVFPEILRHPANCQIITHGDNVSKAQSNNKDGGGQTPDELFEKILNYAQEWKEQQLCVALISTYIGGLRWQRR